jgi:hypothetical protein
MFLARIIIDACKQLMVAMMIVMTIRLSGVQFIIQSLLFRCLSDPVASSLLFNRVSLYNYKYLIKLVTDIVAVHTQKIWVSSYIFQVSCVFIKYQVEYVKNHLSRFNYKN